ncbi:MAG: succinylglutamate desuccinylase [Haliscomenobacteraceae bacterium CHB4]|nr:aspartoacylase [Saprospiraceae bacterium]MCE7925183.1 succinylglutamate desuccinylase [Haliscomenobacteraceae bacterium CHB4]
MDRIIGSFGGTQPGAMVLVFGALHGNEPAGVRALGAIFQMLEREAADNPNFRFYGKLVGVLGNRQAFAAGQRFIEKDLNRQWTNDNIRRIQHNETVGLAAEDLEIAELMSAIHIEITALRPEVLVLLDMHTTSAGGGIFCIPTDEKASLRLAKQLYAPVILNLFEGVEGTLLRFAADGHLQTGGFPKLAFGAAFEAGQHDEPLSVSRSIAAIINCLRATGCIQPEDLPNPYEAVLQEYSNRLPKVTRLRYVHHIRPGDDFRMRPGYVNFQPVQKDEPVADDVTGPILSPDDGLMLMPLYQPKGSDGFFIVQEI